MNVRPVGHVKHFINCWLPRNLIIAIAVISLRLQVVAIESVTAWSCKHLTQLWNSGRVVFSPNYAFTKSCQLISHGAFTLYINMAKISLLAIFCQLICVKVESALHIRICRIAFERLNKFSISLKYVLDCHTCRLVDIGIEGKSWGAILTIISVVCQIWIHWVSRVNSLPPKLGSLGLLIFLQTLSVLVLSRCWRDEPTKSVIRALIILIALISNVQ